MEIKDIRVFVCAPSIGKSYLASIDDRFVDLDEEKTIYKYGYDKDISRLKIEELKGNHGKAKNNDSMQYIKDRFLEELKGNKIILLAPYFLDILEEYNVPYCLIYASLKAKSKLVERMKNRGNQNNFIERIMDSYDEFCKKIKLDNRSIFKISWDGEGYLSDILWAYFGKPVNKL